MTTPPANLPPKAPPPGLLKVPAQEQVLNRSGSQSIISLDEPKDIFEMGGVRWTVTDPNRNRNDALSSTVALVNDVETSVQSQTAVVRDPRTLEAERVAVWNQFNDFRDEQMRVILQDDGMRARFVAYVMSLEMHRFPQFNLPKGFPNRFDGLAAVAWYNQLPKDDPGGPGKSAQNPGLRNTYFTAGVWAQVGFAAPAGPSRTASVARGILGRFLRFLPAIVPNQGEALAVLTLKEKLTRQGDVQSELAHAARQDENVRSVVALQLGPEQAASLSVERPRISSQILAQTGATLSQPKEWLTVGTVYVHLLEENQGRGIAEQLTGRSLPNWSKQDARERGFVLQEGFANSVRVAANVANRGRPEDVQELRQLLGATQVSDESFIRRNLGEAGLERFQRAAALEEVDLLGMAGLQELIGTTGIILGVPRLE